MKKLSILFLAAAFFLLNYSVCKAQGGYQPGYAILADGTRIGGLIDYNESEPWYNQRYIRIKDSVALATNPNTKSKKYKVDDLKFYQVGTHQFDKVHYVNMENLQLKSLGTNDHMLERLALGKISAHRFYQYPEDIDAYVGLTDEQVAEREAQKKNDLITGYKILMQKDFAGKPVDAFDTDMPKYFQDTPEVAEKFKNGGYGNQPAPKKGLAARMISMAKKAAFKPQEADAIIAAINDYNEKNAATGK